MQQEIASAPKRALEQALQLSPLAWVLSYRFPVHRIGSSYRPDSAPEHATYLTVYRNREDKVCFMELNAATAKLLELLRDSVIALTGAEVLSQLAIELGMSDSAVIEFGEPLLHQFLELTILVYTT
jgi:hypothetical protein